MKLILEGTGREVRLVAPLPGSKTMGTVWQGVDDHDVPVLVVAVVVTPLISATDPRQEGFETRYNQVLEAHQLHPEIEMFPEVIEL